MSSYKVFSNRNRLRLTYATVKLSGYVPFCVTLSTSQPSNRLQISSVKSLPSLIYSILIAFLCTILLLSGLLQADGEFLFGNIFLEIFVYSFEDLFVLLKFLVYIFWQIWHRNQLIALIDNGTNVWTHLLNNSSSELLCDERQWQLYTLKFVLSFVQIVVKLLPIFLSIPHLAVFTVTNFLIRHMSVVAINDVFYFGIMSVVLRFYRFVNDEILASDLSRDDVCNRMQRQCNASDQLDRLAILYGKISMYVDDVRKCFQFQILFEIFTSSTIITVEVNLISRIIRTLSHIDSRFDF